MNINDLINKTVQRGPDWRWANQDGGPGGTGVIVAPGPVVGWVKVRWAQNPAHVYDYRMGADSSFDLVVKEDALPAAVVPPSPDGYETKWIKQLVGYLEAGNIARARDMVQNASHESLGVLLVEPEPIRASAQVQQAAEALRANFDLATARAIAQVLSCFHGPELEKLTSPAPKLVRGYLTESQISRYGSMVKSKDSGILFYPQAYCFNALTLSGGGLFRVNLDEASIPTASEVEAFLLLRKDAILYELHELLNRLKK